MYQDIHIQKTKWHIYVYDCKLSDLEAHLVDKAENRKMIRGSLCQGLINCFLRGHSLWIFFVLVYQEIFYFGVYIRTQASGKCTDRHIGSSCLVGYNFGEEYFASRGFTLQVNKGWREWILKKIKLERKKEKKKNIYEFWRW